MGRNFKKNFNNREQNVYVVDRRYDQHDDRGMMDKGSIRDRLGGPKKVGFDVGPRGGGIKKRNMRQDNRRMGNKYQLLPDEDASFDDRSQAGRSRPLRGAMTWRRGGMKGGRPPVPAPYHTPSFTWYKIKIRNGQKYDKNLMFKLMVDRSKVKFIPLCFQVMQAAAFFYVEDVEAAKALKDLNNTLEMPDGYTLQITMEATTAPNVPINEALVDKMKVEMSSRYSLEKKALDLNAFHKSFAGETSYAPLWRSNVLRKAADIVVENIADVTAIDLSNNKLLTLDGLSGVKLPNLRILYLKENRIANINQLDKIKGLPLTELNLMKNPVKDRLTANVYTDKIRDIFPNLQILDDKPMPKKIGFEDESSSPSTSSLPVSIPKYIKSEEAGTLVLQFLEQYFKLYDSDSRQPLLDAYDENAMMSMSCLGPRECMKFYLEESRNFLKISEYKKQKLLNIGRLPIVSFLSKLPKTTHDPTTFTLDLPFTSSTLMMFTVTGIFKDREGSGNEENKIHHFNRCFLVVPRGSGFCIVNETLFVTNATLENRKRAFSSPESNMSSLNASAAAAEAPSTSQVDQATQKTLATAFSELTGMNLEWSARALSENQWNYDKAGQMFHQAKAEGKIPPEAFVK